MSVESTALKPKTGNEQLCSLDDGTTWITESVDESPGNSQNHKNAKQNIPNKSNVEISVHQETPTTPPAHGFSPTTIITTSSSADTLSGEVIGLHGPLSPSNLSLSLNGISKINFHIDIANEFYVYKILNESFFFHAFSL